MKIKTENIVIFALAIGLVVLLAFGIYWALSHLVVWGLAQFGYNAPFWGVFAGWVCLSAVASMFKRAKSN